MLSGIEQTLFVRMTLRGSFSFVDVITQSEKRVCPVALEVIKRYDVTALIKTQEECSGLFVTA